MKRVYRSAAETLVSKANGLVNPNDQIAKFNEMQARLAALEAENAQLKANPPRAARTVNNHAKIEGDFLVIRVPLLATPKPSDTGKTLHIIEGTSRFGTESTAVYNGKPVSISYMAYISAK
jgi:hypothetical protein